MEEKTADVQDSHGSGIIASLFDKARLAKIGQVPRNKKYTFNKDLFKLDYGDSVASLTIQDIHSNLTETLPRWMGTKEMDLDNKVYNTVDRQEEYDPIDRLLLKLGTTQDESPQCPQYILNTPVWE